MKLILILATTLLINTSGSTVYICDSPTAKKYHYSENCRGLNACTHEIKKMNLSEAKVSGRTLCGWED